MKSGVKYRHLRDAATEDPFHRFENARLDGIMRRSEDGEPVDLLCHSGVMRVLSLSFSPPCTTRWPTASIRFRSSITRVSPLHIVSIAGTNSSRSAG
jgi:hypothetical protein